MKSFLPHADKDKLLEKAIIIIIIIIITPQDLTAAQIQ